MSENSKNKEHISVSFTTSLEGLWDWNIKSKEVYFSPSWKSMLGYEDNELVNVFETWEKMVHPSDLPVASNYLKDYLNKKFDHYENNFRMIHKNGSDVHILSKVIKQFTDSEGKIQRLVGINIDVTTIRKAEIQIKKLSTGIEQNPTSIVITDLKGNIEYSNPKFTELTGYSAEEVLGLNSSEFQSGKTDPSVYKNLWSTILNGKTWTGEFINKKKNGKEFIEKATISPIFDQQKRIINFVATYEDITEQRRAEEQIAKQKIALEESYKELEREKKIAEASNAEILKLNEFTRIINSTLNTPKILKEIYSYICETTGFDIVWIILVHKKRKHVYSDPNLSIFKSPELLDIDYFGDFRKNLKESLGILFTTYMTGNPFYISDIESSKRHVINQYNKEKYKLKRLDYEMQKKGNFKSILQLPLFLHDEIIGILNLTGQEKIVEMHETDIHKMMRFADQIAGVISNARILEEMEDAQKEAELSEKIAQMAHKEIEDEKAQVDRLLRNILPTEIARELKEKGSTAPISYKSVSVMFTDFKGFTQIAETMTPSQLIDELDVCFSFFDSLMDRFNIEKLKTIGDSYMCAGGIPVANNTHPVDTVLAALEIQAVLNESKKLRQSLGLPFWELRLGIHTGPLIAGVIGEKKFAYDVWGDTVNIASRMEASGTPEMVNISSSTYELVKEFFECEYRGEVQAKNKGFVEMYYVHRIKKELTMDEEVRRPSFRFWILYDRLRNGEPLTIENLTDRRIGKEDNRKPIVERRKRNLV